MTKLTDAQIAVAGVNQRKAPAQAVERTLPTSENLIDHGADGPAALARPRRIERVATGNTRQGREGADAVRYQDSDPWHHYANAGQITERQLLAGRALTRQYQAGYSAMLAMPSYGSSGGGGLSDEEDRNRSAARTLYNTMADLIPHSARHAMACMVRYEFPTMANRIAYVREGCDVIADYLQLERN
jgi:hypothetical protein